ncbi:MAG TPA: hypothetical protein VHX40_02005 [Acidimicrobiales bacterium]|jgi:hypothetical protein|nr:hypothetical protein [Acidimicrobiales bacterium]
MTADDVAVLVAAIAAALAAGGSLLAVLLLGRRVRELRQLVADLRHETVPLVREARVVVDQASSEMTRVGDVLGSAEAVSATVDSASRLAYRAFANPVVKVLAFGTGTGAALRRLVGRPAADQTPPRRPPAEGRRSDGTAALAVVPASRRHRRRRVRQ